MQFDIFCLILEELPLRRILPLRLVCQQWKSWIDDYLRRQRVLMIGDKPCLGTLSKITLSMKLDFDKIIDNRVSISKRNLLKATFANTLVSMFPNIRELYLFGDTGNSPIPFNVYRKLLHHWNDLEKLLISLAKGENRANLVQSLNELESLRTLILYKDHFDTDVFRLPNEPFMNRLESLLIPSFDWISGLESLPNIRAFGSDDADFYKALPVKLKYENRFPALERLCLSVNFDENPQTLFYSPHYYDVSEFPERIKELKYRNLKILEIFQSTIWSSMYLHNIVPKFQKFVGQLNSFRSVKVLKFQITTMEFLEPFLSIAKTFQHIEELHLLINLPQFGQNIGKPFRKSFPTSMRSIKRVRIRAGNREILNQIRELDYSSLEYAVTFERWFEEYVAGLGFPITSPLPNPL